jgi:tetratricopeptide (TPR) repeat protein
MESTDPTIQQQLSAEDMIKVIRQKLNDMELVDNSYFQKDRGAKIRKMHEEIISMLDTKMFDLENANKKIKSNYFYLKGKTMDFIPELQKEAEELLAKAVKLKPCWHEPMRALAHVYWKKQDYVKSVMLYQNAIEEEPEDKRSLRCLSMVIRKVPTKNAKERSQMLDDSISYAKKAVSIDLKDSESWYVLGNAHLTNFFMNGQKYEHLDYALKAYTQSEKLQIYRNPDLYYNRATIYNYLERYSDAINDYETAHSIDQNLGAMEKARSIQSYVINVCSLIKKKCSLKTNKFVTLVKSIPKSIGEVKFMKKKSEEEVKKLEDSEGDSEKEVPPDKAIKYTVTPLLKLERGFNPGCVFIGKLV